MIDGMKTTGSVPPMFTLYDPLNAPLGTRVSFRPMTHMEDGVLLDSVDVRESYSDGVVISHKEVSREKGRSLWADYSARGWTTSR